MSASEKIVLPGGTSFEMVHVKGGEFMMGSDRYEDEKPIHPVRLRDFYLSRNLVSQSLWKEVMGRNSTNFPHPNRPVERISWYEAVEFCNKLSRKLGLRICYQIDKEREFSSIGTVSIIPEANGFCLPTEAQWEYAARGGAYSKGNIYSGSLNKTEVAWNIYNSQGLSKLIGLKRPNALGLYDLSGNVQEWCWDRFSSHYFQHCKNEGIVENPIYVGSGWNRIVRGGSWRKFGVSLRVSNRGKVRSDARTGSIGFRLSRH